MPVKPIKQPTPPYVKLAIRVAIRSCTNIPTSLMGTIEHPHLDDVAALISHIYFLRVSWLVSLSLFDPVFPSKFHPPGIPCS